jgi:PAP2 superfamily
MTVSVAESGASGSRAAVWRGLRASLRENCLLVAFTVIFGLVPLLVAERFAIAASPYESLALAYLGFLMTAAIGVFAAFAFWYLYHSRVLKVPNFQSHAAHRIKTDFLKPERLILALPILLLWPITAVAFSYLKSALPVLQPFYLDPLLHDWDTRLHFGVEPWRILQPLLGYTWVTYLINLGYTMWFFVLQAALVLQSGAIGDRRTRMQFLLTMALSWALIGSLAATLMSSAGPCYYGLVVGGDNPYAPLMAYLRGVGDNLTIGDVKLPFAVLFLQDLLWQGLSTSDHGIGKGISAAPSMHVASSWIVWRLCWTMGRKAKIAGSLFLAMIFIGSIHLGWHYALDGYIAIAIAWMIWRAVGWLLKVPQVRTLLWPQRAVT